MPAAPAGRTTTAGPLRRAAVLLGLLLASLLIARPAFAHASEKGFVLLLPTGYYIVGGTFAVAASFLLFFLVPGAAMHRLAAARVEFGRLPRIPSTATSLVACLAFCSAAMIRWRTRCPWRSGRSGGVA
jgi:hypothetical protein